MIPIPFHLRVLAVLALGVKPVIGPAQGIDVRGRIIELFSQAQSNEQAQNYAGAVDRYREILRLSPDIAEVWSNLGSDLFRAGRLDEAIAAFQHAVSLKPSLVAPHLFTGKAYLQLSQPQKAVAPLKRALALAPEEPEVLLALGDAYSETKQFGQAVRLLQKAVESAPDSEDASSRLAVAYLEWAKDLGGSLRLSSSVYGHLITDRKRAIEHPDTAEAELTETVVSAPTLVEARLDLVDLLITRDADPASLKKCKEQIDAGLRNEPHNPSLLAAAVRLALALHANADASAKVNALASIDPAFTSEHADSLTEGLSPEIRQSVSDRIRSQALTGTPLAGSYSARFSKLDRTKSQRTLSPSESAEFASAASYLGRYREAFAELSGRTQLSDAEKYWLFRTCAELGQQVLEHTVSAHPDSVRTHLLLANFATQQGRLDTARSEYTAALTLRPNDPDITLLYVRFLETAGELNKATETAGHAATEWPRHPGVNFEAGHLILLSGGDMSTAVRYLQNSIQSDPAPFEPHVDLSKAFGGLGRIDDAVREMNLVLDHDEDGSMHFLLARWYRQLGRPADAAKAMQICQQIKDANLRKERETISGRSR